MEFDLYFQAGNYDLGPYKMAVIARNPKLRYLLKILLVSVIYIASAQLGFLMTVLHGADSLFWPPAGFALAALLLLGDNVWPGITIGILVINISGGQTLT